MCYDGLRINIKLVLLSNYMILFPATFSSKQTQVLPNRYCLCSSKEISLTYWNPHSKWQYTAVTLTIFPALSWSFRQPLQTLWRELQLFLYVGEFFQQTHSGVTEDMWRNNPWWHYCIQHNQTTHERDNKETFDCVKDGYLNVFTVIFQSILVSTNGNCTWQ